MWSSENHAFDGSSCYLIGAKGDNNPFLNCRGAEGPNSLKLHHVGIRVKICSIIDKKNHKSFLYIFKIWRLKFIFAHSCKPNKKSCQISPEGDNPNWNQNGRKLFVRSAKFTREKNCCHAEMNILISCHLHVSEAMKTTISLFNLLRCFSKRAQPGKNPF